MGHHATPRGPTPVPARPLTLMLLFSSEPSVRRKASWPSVPSTRRKQLVVWPIPEGRTLSQSMALITVLFPLLVLWDGEPGGQQSRQPLCLGFHDEVISLEAQSPVLCSDASAQTGRGYTEFAKMVGQAPLACAVPSFITTDHHARCQHDDT